MRQLLPACVLVLVLVSAPHALGMVTYTGTMTGTVISVYDAGASSMEIEVVWPPFTASFAS